MRKASHITHVVVEGRIAWNVFAAEPPEPCKAQSREAIRHGFLWAGSKELRGVLKVYITQTKVTL